MASTRTGKSSSGKASSKVAKSAPARSAPTKTKTSARGERPRQNDNPIPNPATERARQQQRAGERDTSRASAPAAPRRTAKDAPPWDSSLTRMTGGVNNYPNEQRLAESLAPRNPRNLLRDLAADESTPDPNYGRRRPSVPSGSTGSTYNRRNPVSQYDQWTRDIYAGIAPGQGGVPAMTVKEARAIRDAEEAKRQRRRSSRKQTPK